MSLQLVGLTSRSKAPVQPTPCTLVLTDGLGRIPKVMINLGMVCSQVCSTRVDG